MVDPIFPKANILVVDDFEPWRSQIREILQARPEWTIVSEACDGPEAVQKATALQPDIILLDFGLPTLNGIEAAKLIQQRCPESRIIFLTANEDKEIMSEALRIPRARYLLKINAATDLLDVISAALHDC
ncbi:MAG TPA: response regulator transcription factor [Terriglobales bacterium]|nr:response regulator transcription factor [Terriglobales bacterium]